jgi:hypothetical protein
MTIEYNGYELVQECHLAAGWSEATFLHWLRSIAYSSYLHMSKRLHLDTVRPHPALMSFFPICWGKNVAGPARIQESHAFKGRFSQKPIH